MERNDTHGPHNGADEPRGLTGRRISQNQTATLLASFLFRLHFDPVREVIFLLRNIS
jgi:hypothetical protein